MSYANKCRRPSGAHQFKPTKLIDGWQWFRCLHCTHVTARPAKMLAS